MMETGGLGLENWHPIRPFRRDAALQQAPRVALGCFASASFLDGCDDKKGTLYIKR
jgi:hypothetical protein